MFPVYSVRFCFVFLSPCPSEHSACRAWHVRVESSGCDWGKPTKYRWANECCSLIATIKGFGLDTLSSISCICLCIAFMQHFLVLSSARNSLNNKVGDFPLHFYCFLFSDLLAFSLSPRLLLSVRPPKHAVLAVLWLFARSFILWMRALSHCWWLVVLSIHHAQY